MHLWVEKNMSRSCKLPLGTRFLKMLLRSGNFDAIHQGYAEAMAVKKALKQMQNDFGLTSLNCKLYVFSIVNAVHEVRQESKA